MSDIVDRAPTSSHEVVLHRGWDELPDELERRVLAAVHGGCAVVVAGSGRLVSLVASVVTAAVREIARSPDVGSSMVEHELGAGDRPAVVLRDLGRTIADLAARGARRVLVIVEPPPSSRTGADEPGASWRSWLRFDRSTTVAWGDLPVDVVCTYDADHTPAEVLAVLRRLHGADAAPLTNADLPPPPPVPMAESAPAFDLIDVVASRGRSVALDAAGAAGLAEREANDLELAVSEVVMNANAHGQPPVRMRVWTAPGAVVIDVLDRGPGVDDPVTGLVPVRRAPGEGGFGLWLAHQLCLDVFLTGDEDGSRVRLVIGRPPS